GGSRVVHGVYLSDAKEECSESQYASVVLDTKFRLESCVEEAEIRVELDTESAAQHETDAALGRVSMRGWNNGETVCANGARQHVHRVKRKTGFRGRGRHGMQDGNERCSRCMGYSSTHEAAEGEGNTAEDFICCQNACRMVTRTKGSYARPPFTTTNETFHVRMMVKIYTVVCCRQSHRKRSIAFKNTIRNVKNCEKLCSRVWRSSHQNWTHHLRKSERTQAASYESWQSLE
ncbi:unnamed protein product, partial [Pylaiella littoralis]